MSIKIMNETLSGNQTYLHWAINLNVLSESLVFGMGTYNIT